jgi:hypothetical protein
LNSGFVFCFLNQQHMQHKCHRLEAAPGSHSQKQ